MDSSLVVYTGASTPNIPLPTNTNLEAALQLIDTALAAGSSAPDYSGYNLACVKQTDGTSHPTNTQNFAEGISKILCDLKTAYTAFTGTTYPTNQGVITTAINGLQSPGYVYAPFSIVNTDGINTVWSKVFTGLTGITNSIKPDSANWSSIGASTQTTIVGALNTLIAYDVTQDTTISGKQASLGTFNTTSIGGGSGTAPATAITQLITWSAALPVFAPGSITSTCVSAGVSLQAVVQNICNTIDTISVGRVSAAGAGLTLGSPAGCGGKSISLDTSYPELYKVAVDSGDVPGGFLEDKIESSDNSLTITNTGSTLDLSVTTPVDHKVKVNNSGVAGYLADKIPTVGGDWGMALVATVVDDQLILTPKMLNPDLFVSNLFTFVNSDPDMLAQWCALSTQCTGGTCAPPTAFTVTKNGTSFVLAWTVGGTPVSQRSKYRLRGDVDWITNVNISPANPEANNITQSTIANLCANTVYQFQVDSVCTNNTGSTAVKEGIIYSCQTLSSNVTAGVITVTQDPLLTVDTIEYVLYSGQNALQTVTATGANPIGKFQSVNSGTYTVKWRYGATVNGTTLYSNDASQLNSYCTSGNIVV